MFRLKFIVVISLIFALAQIYFLTGCQTTASSSIREPNESSSELEIQRAINTAQKDGSLPAIGTLITSGEKTIFANSQGKRAVQFDTPVELRDQWHLGSDTKAMTALLVAMAIQEKRFSYDSNVVRLLQIQSANSQNFYLKVSDLLSHSSGLKDVQEVQNGKLWEKLFQSSKSLKQQRLEMSLASLMEAPTLDKSTGKPIRTFHYGNINYIILGAVLEKVYKTSWENLIQKRIFKKLEMNSCGFGVAGSETETSPSQPWPHGIENNKLTGIPPKEKADNPPMLGPAGTVHCNLRDWNKFISELIKIWNNNGVLITDKFVAKKYFEKGNETYTFGGWGRNDEKFNSPLFQHSGSNTFNFATAEFLPEKNLIILVATNRGDDIAESAIRTLLNSLNNIVVR